MLTERDLLDALEARIGSLPVIENGKLVGIVTDRVVPVARSRRDHQGARDRKEEPLTIATFYRTVMKTAENDDRGLAKRATAAVFHALRDRLTPEDARVRSEKEWARPPLAGCVVGQRRPVSHGGHRTSP